MAKDKYPVLLQTEDGELSQTMLDKLTQEQLKAAFNEELFIIRLSPEINKFQIAEIDEPETSEDEYEIFNWTESFIEEALETE